MITIMVAMTEKKEYVVEGEFAEEVSCDNLLSVFKDLRISRNGKEISEFGERWNGHIIDGQEFAAGLVCAFFNGDNSVWFEYIDENIVKFKEKEQLYKQVQNTLIPFYVLNLNGTKLELQAVSKDYMRFYIKDDECALTRADGSLATDMEVFFYNTLEEEVQEGSLIFIGEAIA